MRTACLDKLKAFSQWNEVFVGVTIASAILDRVPHHCTVISIKGESYRLKGRKEFMRQKQQTVNTLLVQGSTWFLLPPQKNDKISSAFSYNFKPALTRGGTGEIYQPEATAALELLAIENNLTNWEYVLIEKFLKLKTDIRTALICYLREVAASIANGETDGFPLEEPVMPDAAATGIPLTNDEIKGRTALYTEMAQESAYRELQRAGVDPEIETEVEAYRQRRIQKKKQALQTSAAKECGRGRIFSYEPL